MIYILTTIREEEWHAPRRKVDQMRNALRREEQVQVIYDLGNASIGEDDVVIAMTKDPRLLWQLNTMHVRSTAGSIETASFDENKNLFKTICRAVGINVPKDIRIADDGSELSSPVFVKPAKLGNSVGIDSHSYCLNRQDALEKIKTIRPECGVMVEEYIKGVDFVVGLMDIDGELRTFPAYVTSGTGIPFLSEEVKTIDVEKVLPMTNTIGRKCASMAKKAFMAVGGRKYGRVDGRITDDGHVYLLELNTLAGFGSHGYMYRAVEMNTGATYHEFVKMLIKTASYDGE